MHHSDYENFDQRKKTDKTVNAYNLLKYDLIYFIVKKELADEFNHKEFLRYDEKKGKHYLKGRIVEVPGVTARQAFVFLDVRKYESFHLEKKVEVKRRLVRIIPFTFIEAIVVKMEHVDYM